MLPIRTARWEVTWNPISVDRMLPIEGGPGGVDVKMRKRRVLILMIAFLLMFGVFAFFGEKGIFNLLRLQKEVVRIKEKNSKLEEENRQLKEEVKRLQSDKRYIEAIARKELGMVKEGEIIYQFEDKKGDRQPFDGKGRKEGFHENPK